MKKNLYLLLLVFVLAACSKDDSLPIPQIAGVEVDGGTSAGGKNQLTKGESATFSVKCENVAVARYEWTVNDQIKSDKAEFVFTPDKRGSYAISVKVYNADGGASETKGVGTYQVVDPKPVIDGVTCGGQAVTDGATVDLQVGTTAAKIVVKSSNVEIASYAWSVGGAAVENKMDSYDLPTDKSGSFPVAVTLANLDELSTTVSFTVNINGPYKEGILFYGTTSEGFAFYDPAKNGGTFYEDHLYKTINGDPIGKGGVNDLYIYNNKLYLLTPSSESTRAQIVVCDAQTLVKEKAITADGFNTASLGEIYSLLAVNENKFYVGSNNSAGNTSRISILDVKADGSNTFRKLVGTEGKLGVDGPCWSRMLKSGKNAWIGCGSKIRVFDCETDQEVKSIEIDPDRQVSDIVKGKDGNIYALVAGKADKSASVWMWSYTTPASVVAIDPASLTVKSETEILVDGAKADIGGLEGANTCASLTSDELFFKAGGWMSKVYRFNYKTGVTSVFWNQSVSSSKYMAADKDGLLYIPQTPNYSNNIIHVFRISDGQQMTAVEGKIGTVNGDGGAVSTYYFAE